MLWTEKYKPKKSADVISHGIEVHQIKELLKEKRKAILIYGKTGTGKTSAVHAIAKELDLELLEVNASDARNKKSIHATLGSSSQQMSLFGRGKIILVDEADGMSGNKDRGGIQELIRIIDSSKHPIIITANDPDSKKLKSLLKKCNTIEFKTPEPQEIFELLKEIATEEKIKVKDPILKSMARRCGGDVRAAVNDLQVLSAVSKEITELEDLGDRAREDSIENVLMLIFKSKKPENVLWALDKTNVDLKEAIMWIDESLPKEYSGEDLRKAYYALSKADVYNGRIRRWQHWRFLVYINALITAGVAVAKTERNKADIKYKRSGRILQMWISKMRNMKRNAIAEKLAEHTHTSKAKTIQEMPYLKQALKKPNPDLIDELELTDEHLEWLSR